VRRISLAGLVLALALALPAAASAAPLLTLRHDGGAFAREDPYLPPASDPGPARAPAAPAARRMLPGAPPAPRAERVRAARATRGQAARPTQRARAASGASKRTVRGELARMLAAGAIDEATYRARLATYTGARGLLRRLGGARRASLGAVLGQLEQIAARGELTVSRLPALFETVARNRDWWSRGPLLSYGQRVSFQGSPLVWQYYTGEGLQIQWLGTFGKANALWKSRTHDADLRELLDAALRLAAQRAGGIAFEYLFAFDGGRPPWVSGLAQGTGIQALSRAAVRLAQPRFFEAARSALGVFREPPPSGVRVSTARGAHYLIYSFAPRLRVLNAFTQALNGLHDFALLANDAEGRALFSAGEAELRSELPAYDTGAWSRYSLHREADLSYHTLARDFLVSLCSRLRDDAARAAAGAVAAPSTGGGAPTAAPLPEPAPPPDAAPYCDMAHRFTSYLRQPPVVRLVSRRARAGRPAVLRLDVSKPSYLKLAVQRRGRTVMVLSARLASGRHALVWARPRAAADYEVLLRATDLAGNVGSAKGELEVLKANRKRR
jgi:D-glucuronyl C5-epimerase C-terminus